MTDHELLKLAAKASDNYDLFKMPGIQATKIWNPLTNDGDALRLAVKLGIGLWHHIQIGEVEAEPHTPSIGSFCEFYENDPFAATRRAIVRAAAEIGKMKGEKL